jgi:hypothetical protein
MCMASIGSDNVGQSLASHMYASVAVLRASSSPATPVSEYCCTRSSHIAAQAKPKPKIRAFTYPPGAHRGARDEDNHRRLDESTQLGHLLGEQKKIGMAAKVASLREKQPVLNLCGFYRSRTFLVVVRHAGDPGAHGMTSHHSSVAGTQQFERPLEQVLNAKRTDSNPVRQCANNIRQAAPVPHRPKPTG